MSGTPGRPEGSDRGASGLPTEMRCRKPMRQSHLCARRTRRRSLLRKSFSSATRERVATTFSNSHLRGNVLFDTDTAFPMAPMASKSSRRNVRMTTRLSDRWSLLALVLSFSLGLEARSSATTMVIVDENPGVTRLIPGITAFSSGGDMGGMIVQAFFIHRRNDRQDVEPGPGPRPRVRSPHRSGWNEGRFRARPKRRDRRRALVPQEPQRVGSSPR
jgi:hypothetical protein